ncbi:MAG: ATP-binding protein, partial [Thioalkalivibrio sp.]
LTQRLLAFSRQQPLVPKLVDVNQLLAGMDPLLRRTLGEQVRVELLLQPGLWPALIDPGQLEGAILNLCLNARDAMPGGGRLTIRTVNHRLSEAAANHDAELTAGEYVELAISDTGSGIAPEHIDQVFDPFFTTKEKGKGTGLGLSMVYGFVRQSGGAVTIDSALAEGTTVRLLLKRAGETETAAGAAAPRDEALAGGSERILVVEDEDLVRAFVVRQLEALGYQVEEARDGDQAMDVLRHRHDIDLLFTDVVMPGRLNGLMLAEEARSLRPGLKVLFTSGYTQNARIDHGRLDAGVHLLSKPYRRAELARKVREALS